MSLKPRPLFTSEPIELKRDQALRALDRAVARLRPKDLADPALSAKLAERHLPRPPRLGTQVLYRLFEVETGGEGEDPGSGRWGAGLEATLRFYGAADYFELRAGAQPLRPPAGTVRGRRLTVTVIDDDGSEDLVERLDAQLETVRRELEEQRRRCESMREALESAAGRMVAARRTRIALLGAAADVLSARGWLAERRRA